MTTPDSTSLCTVTVFGLILYEIPFSGIVLSSSHRGINSVYTTRFTTHHSGALAYHEFFNHSAVALGNSLANQTVSYWSRTEPND